MKTQSKVERILQWKPRCPFFIHWVCSVTFSFYYTSIDVISRGNNKYHTPRKGISLCITHLGSIVSLFRLSPCSMLNKRNKTRDVLIVICWYDVQICWMREREGVEKDIIKSGMHVRQRFCPRDTITLIYMLCVYWLSLNWWSTRVGAARLGMRTALIEVVSLLPSTPHGVAHTCLLLHL